MGLFGRRRKTASEVVANEETDRAGLVVPLMAGRAWLAGTEESLARIPDFPDEAKPFTAELSEELSAAYAADPQGSWEMIQRGEVEAFGGRDALHRTAVENLLRRADDVLVEGGAGRYRVRVPSEPDIAASLILAPQLWRERMELAGDPVICAPTRVVLLVCGSEDAEAVETLHGYATAMFDEADGKPVTTALHTIGASGLSVLR